MGLDSAQIESLRKALSRLAPLDRFRSGVLDLRKKPFIDPAPRDDFEIPAFLTLDEMRKTGLNWKVAIPLGSIASIVIFAVGIAIKRVGLASFGNLLSLLRAGLKLSAPTSHWTLLSIWSGLWLLCIAASLRATRRRVHVLDPLFGRILQFKLQEKKPLSTGTVFILLADRRFDGVLARAIDLVLPAPELITADANEDRRWKSFVERLVAAVEDDDCFSELLTNRGGPREPGSLPQIVIDDALGGYLIYVTRKLLFEALGDDPDLHYMYDGMTDWRKEIKRWLAALDWGKAKDLFGQTTEKATAHGADIQGIANIILVVLLALIAAKSTSLGFTKSTEGDDEQVKTLVAQVSAYIGNLAKQPPYQPQCPQPSTINLVAPAAPPQTITVPPVQTVSFPPKFTFEWTPPLTVPKDLVLNVKSTSSSTSADTGNTVQPSASSQNPASQPAGCDKKCYPQTHLVEDTLVKLKKGDTNKQFSFGSYSYEATVLWEQSETPHSVAINLSPLQFGSYPCNKDGIGCPKEQTVYASETPIYSALLNASVSVEGMHRKYPLAGKEEFVLRIHPEAAMGNE